MGLCARTPIGCELLREQFGWPAVECCSSRDACELARAVDEIIQSVRCSEPEPEVVYGDGGGLPDATAATADDAFDVMAGSQSERGFTEFGIWVGEQRSPSISTASANSSSAGGPTFFVGGTHSDGGSLASGARRRSSVHNELLDSVRLQESLLEHRRSQSNENLVDIGRLDNNWDEMRQRKQSEPEEFSPGAMRPNNNPPTSHLPVAMSSVSLQPPNRPSRTPSTEESTHSLPTCEADSASSSSATAAAATATAAEAGSKVTARRANRDIAAAPPAQYEYLAPAAAPSSKAARLLGLAVPNVRQRTNNRRASEYIARNSPSLNILSAAASSQSRGGPPSTRTVTPDEKRSSVSSATDGIFFVAPTARQQKFSTASSKAAGAAFSGAGRAPRGSRHSVPLPFAETSGGNGNGALVGICFPRALLLPADGDARQVHSVGISAPAECVDVAEAEADAPALASGASQSADASHISESARDVHLRSSSEPQAALRLQPPHTFQGFSSAQHRRLCLVCAAREFIALLLQTHSGIYSEAYYTVL